MLTMTNLSRLLGITAVGASIAKARLVQRFINDLAGVITLAIATGCMAGALLIGGFYIAYQGLVRYGLDQFAAELLIAAFAAATVILMISRITARLRGMGSIPGNIIQTEFPLANRLNGLVDSFIDGVLSAAREPQK
jgi:hypothetical protein